MKNRNVIRLKSDPQRIWQVHVKAMEESGLSRAEYCRRRNLSYHALGYWLRKLAKPIAKPSILVPITLPAQINPDVSTANQAALTILLPGKVAVAVGDNFSSVTLNKLLTLLENR